MSKLGFPCGCGEISCLECDRDRLKVEVERLREQKSYVRNVDRWDEAQRERESLRSQLAAANERAQHAEKDWNGLRDAVMGEDDAQEINRAYIEQTANTLRRELTAADALLVECLRTIEDYTEDLDEDINLIQLKILRERMDRITSHLKPAGEKP